jgi:erythritol transport system ATP-binding protein
LMGLHPEATGTIYLNGKAVGDGRIAQRIEQGITLVPEDRQRLGLVQQLTVSQNLTLASLAKACCEMVFPWVSQQGRANE